MRLPMGSRSFEPLVKLVTKKDNSTGDIPAEPFDDTFILFARCQTFERESRKICQKV